MKPSIITFLLLFFISISFEANSQIAVTNIDDLSEIKKGTTYVLMKDIISERAKEYMSVFDKYWTFSKIEFILSSDLSSHISPEDSYINIGGLHTIKIGSSYQQIHLYFRFWNFKDSFFNKKKSKIDFDKDVNQIARTEVFTDEALLGDLNKIFLTEYDSDKHLRNWGPGVLKNNIQALMTLLNNNEEKSLYSKIRKEEKIQSLRTDTLYVVDYLLIKRNKFTGDESKRFKEKDIFKYYKSNYKMISIEELNDKILSDEEFYYLSYLRSSAHKFVSIINSKTGEYIYSAYNPMSYNFGSKDLRAIQEILD